MGKKIFGECAYCGEFSELTEDHVVPKCLFEKPYPENMVIVNACNKCNNNEKSQNDSFLRDLLVVDLNSQANPIARKLYYTKFLSSASKKKSEFVKKSTIDNPTLVPILTESGLYIGDCYKFYVDGKRIESTLFQIVRGLKYHLLGERIDIDSNISVTKIPNFQEFHNEFEICRQTIGGNYVFLTLGNTFHYYMMEVETADGFNFSYWWLVFYESVYYSVFINNFK